ncbi:MAG: OadG family protein [Lachnospiraceae bacterium]|nr:OadG family protein [Lachnospiraceae bacterium]
MTITTILVKALTNTVLGMGTVFLVLIFIAFLISLLPGITAVIESVGRKKESVQSFPRTQTSSAASPVSASDSETDEEPADDMELAAVIAAAVAASEGIPADAFIVRSIRRVPGNQWKKR